MRTLISHLLALVLLLQALPGWCCHWADDNGPARRDIARPKACCSHCHRDAPASPKPAQPPRRSMECEGVCVYPPESAPVRLAPPAATWADAACLVTVTSSAPASTPAFHAWLTGRPMDSAPVHRHSWRQTLLI